MYRILASAFSPPKNHPNSLHHALLEAHSALTNQSEDQTDDAANSLALDREHLRLFVGPGHTPCPPYESVYRKDRPALERGLVMGPSTADVRRTYISAGLDLSQTNTELPDHIATEMEFMHFLCAEEARNMKIGNTKEATRMRQLQREFHKNHVGVWVDDFADCILHATTSPFYRTAANVLKKYAHDESGYFDGE